MTQRKQTTIKQGAVTDVMSRLASLPERGREPEDLVNLSEIFRTKEYIAEIKAALKKGYTFDDLAEIFTDRCGVSVSARQIKYHFTRGKNLGAKKKSGKNPGENTNAQTNAPSADCPQKDAEGDGKENFTAANLDGKPPLEAEPLVSGNHETGWTESEAFFTEKRQLNI